jgi:chorismate synthase
MKSLPSPSYLANASAVMCATVYPSRIRDANGAGGYARRSMSRLRWMTAGESHGPELVAIVEGIPAGLGLLAEHVDGDLARRQKGYGRGGRMKIETDRVSFVGGVRGGETLGGPIAMVVANKDHASWAGRMGPDPFPSPPEPLTRPRPGHADLAGGLKYDRRDLRDVLERASARETAMRVAVGGVCRRLLGAVGVEVFAHVVSIGPVEADVAALPVGELRARAASSDLRCADAAAEAKMREAIHAASHAGDTLGGVFEVVATGAPPGLGSHVQWDRKLDGRLAQALMSIQAIKGVELGLGFDAARRPGSEVHDPIAYDAAARGFARPSNRAGGLEGGITNGMPIVCRAAMKPIATLKRALGSVDVATKEPYEAAFERSDICAVAAASVVGEAMVAITLADALLEKFGGDSMGELARNVESFRAQLAAY